MYAGQGGFCIVILIKLDGDGRAGMRTLRFDPGSVVIVKTVNGSGVVEIVPR